MAGACNPTGRTMIDGQFSKREKKPSWLAKDNGVSDVVL